MRTTTCPPRSTLRAGFAASSIAKAPNCTFRCTWMLTCRLTWRPSRPRGACRYLTWPTSFSRRSSTSSSRRSKAATSCVQTMNLDKLKTTGGLDVAAKRVLYRADLNVPVKAGKVTDATRLERIVPGLLDLTRRGAKVVVVSHFGRPKGGPDPEFTLAPVAHKLGELLGKPIKFAADCVGDAATRVVEALQPGDIAVLENLRFHKGEEKNDPEFAKALARLGDIFVSDAFSTAHRA